MSEPVRVPVGACRCPRTPHTEGDWVDLAPRMTLPIGVAAWYVIQHSHDPAELQGKLAETYLRLGIVGWSFTDENERPIAFDPDRVDEFLPLWEGGFTVAMRADALYSEDLTLPLASAMAKLRESSPDGPTDSSTSASPDISPRPPTRSRRSSHNGTAGKPSEAPAP